HHAEAGGDRTAEQGGDFHVAVCGNRRNPVFSNDGVLVEGGDPASVDGSAIPFVLGGHGFDAQALAPVQHDLVARLHVTHTGAGFNHRARTFVAQQVRQELVLALGAVDLAQ